MNSIQKNKLRQDCYTLGLVKMLKMMANFLIENPKRDDVIDQYQWLQGELKETYGYDHPDLDSLPDKKEKVLVGLDKNTGENKDYKN